jgi:hypothetical protein
MAVCCGRKRGGGLSAVERGDGDSCLLGGRTGCLKNTVQPVKGVQGNVCFAHGYISLCILYLRTWIRWSMVCVGVCVFARWSLSILS